MITEIFKKINDVTDVITTIRISYIEIYNDNIYDLLQSDDV